MKTKPPVGRLGSNTIIQPRAAHRPQVAATGAASLLTASSGSTNTSRARPGQARPWAATECGTPGTPPWRLQPRNGRLAASNGYCSAAITLKESQRVAAAEVIACARLGLIQHQVGKPESRSRSGREPKVAKNPPLPHTDGLRRGASVGKVDPTEAS